MFLLLLSSSSSKPPSSASGVVGEGAAGAVEMDFARLLVSGPGRGSDVNVLPAESLRSCAGSRIFLKDDVDGRDGDAD